MTYVIFRTGDKQFRAEVGRRMRVPLLDTEPGKKVSFDDVLLASDGKTVVAGTPNVKGAQVSAKVLDHRRDDKIIVFKHKRRKNYRRKSGHRQDFTEIEITGVKVGS